MRALGIVVLTATALVFNAVPGRADDAKEANRPVGPLSAEANLHWQVAIVPSQAKPGDDVELAFTTDIAPGWIVYSSDFKVEIGPRRRPDDPP